jgi:hypothetical protein
MMYSGFGDDRALTYDCEVRWTRHWYSKQEVHRAKGHGTPEAALLAMYRSVMPYGWTPPRWWQWWRWHDTRLPRIGRRGPG